MCIVIDDLVSQLKQVQNIPDFIELFYNRRHLLNHGVISFIITTQKWNMVPTVIRTCANMLILFPLTRMQIEAIYRDINVDFTKRTFLHLMGLLKKHDFYYLNQEDGGIYNKSWNKI